MKGSITPSFANDLNITSNFKKSSFANSILFSRTPTYKALVKENTLYTESITEKALCKKSISVDSSKISMKLSFALKHLSPPTPTQRAKSQIDRTAEAVAFRLHIRFPHPFVLSQGTRPRQTIYTYSPLAISIIPLQTSRALVHMGHYTRSRISLRWENSLSAPMNL